MDKRIRKELDSSRRVHAALQKRVQLAEVRLVAARQGATGAEEAVRRLMAMLDPAHPLSGGDLGGLLAQQLGLASGAAQRVWRDVSECEAALRAAKVSRAAAERLEAKRALAHRRAAEAEELAGILDALAAGKLPAMLPS